MDGTTILVVGFGCLFSIKTSGISLSYVSFDFLDELLFSFFFNDL
jgi:hypothetical protein